MKERTILLPLLCMTLLLAVAVTPVSSKPASGPVAPSEDPYVFLDAWGNEMGVFHSPGDVAVYGNRIYVLDTGSDRIQVFDRQGRPLSIIGSGGSGDGQFWVPKGIAVDGQGNLYVADSGNDRVQKFAPDGTFLLQWGSQGTAAGQFNYPSGIAVDGDGEVFVADTDNDRIQKFTADGGFVTKWGNSLTLNGPHHLAVDVEGYVYITDRANHRVVKYDNLGAFVTTWGSEGTAAGQFRYPNGIAVDGDVYVADNWNQRVQVFTSDGTYLNKWGNVGEPSGLELDGRGAIYVGDVDGDAVLKLTTGGSLLTRWGASPGQLGQFDGPWGLAGYAAPDLVLYVIENDGDRVQKLSRYGNPLGAWGGHGSADGHFNVPCGAAMDGSGNLYVADMGNYRVQKFDGDGNFLLNLGGFDLFQDVFDVAVDGSGNVYAVDITSNDVNKLAPDGTYLLGWGEYGTADGEFQFPAAILAHSGGSIYVTESSSGMPGQNQRIQQFTSDGTYLSQWGSPGSDPGQFQLPLDITADGNGDLYVADSGNHRIQKFEPDGTFLLQWGSQGNGDGQFNYPVGIYVHDDDTIFVADGRNNRIQVFAPDYPAPDLTFGLALNGSFEEAPDLARWTYGGELPVSLVSTAYHGTQAAQLGEPTPQTEHDQGKAWLRQTVYVRPEWQRPVLTFRYRILTNDTIDYSDFYAWLSTSNGALLGEVVRDGFRPCTPGTPPPAGFDLGWRTATYDLSHLKGQNVRLVFENRNLHGGYSWGIWTYVDDVRLVDAGPLPALSGPNFVHVPLILHATCDPLPAALEDQHSPRPTWP